MDFCSFFFLKKLVGDYSVLHPEEPRCFQPSLGSPEKPLKFSGAKRRNGGRVFFESGDGDIFVSLVEMVSKANILIYI